MAAGGRAAEFEDAIQAAFAACCRIAYVAPDDDFFEIGGNSLHAARVLERIYQTLHVRLQPDVFFTCPTPRLLAGAVAAHHAEAPARDGSIVPLNAEGQGKPVFFVHGATPRPWMFRDVVPALQLRRPIYGTKAPDLAWERDVLTIEEMAVHYATEIRRMQPRGPYSLLGFSLGGTLAFAIAARLARDGQAVPHLVLLDTAGPGLSRSWWRTHAVFTAIDLLGALCRLGVVSDAVVRRFDAGALPRRFRAPFDRIRLVLGAGPLTTTELRTALNLAFPGYAYRRTGDMSFEHLCSAIVEEIERTVSEKQWKRLIRRAGSEDPRSVIKAQKLVAKNARLAHRYVPRAMYEGRITIYAREGNPHVNRWQRFTSRPLDIRRVMTTSARGRNVHRQFIAPHNLQLYAADLRDFLESGGHD